VDVRQAGFARGAGRRGDVRALWASITSLLAWVLANGLDVFSVLILVQAGRRMVFARHHPAESFLVYAGLRLLGTMALPLAVAASSKRWPAASRAAWGALTACALATAAAAWWRLYR
jgi:hypothetical protein